MQKYVNLVDLVKSFPTIIYLQKLASIQPRTSLSKCVYLVIVFNFQVVGFNFHRGAPPEDPYGSVAPTRGPVREDRGPMREDLGSREDP